ncbi:hypothetical protein Q1695_003462 [Nippostrongylus brasiliensis]|nr:hypothetical protein Q1695_003462 [Nippostrongylus brasiliensis]
MFNTSIHEHYGPIDDERFEWIYSVSASTMMLGLLVGFLIMGDLMDRLGRKESAIFVRCILGFASAGAMVLSFALCRFELFVIGHFLAGVVAALKVVLLIYMAECSPDDKRGFTSMLLNSGSVIAVLVFTPLCLPSVIGSDTLWCVLPALCALMAVIHLILASSFPQSPKQLYIQARREEEAIAALQYYYGSDYDIDDAIEEMETERSYESHTSVSFKDIMRHRTYRYSFVLVLLSAFTPPLSALNMKLQYLLSWFISYGLSQSQATTAITVVNLVALPLCFLAPWMIERFGRRRLFAVITSLCALEWLLFGFAELLTSVSSQAATASWLLATIAATMGQCSVNIGLLIMAPIMISEVCPQNTRAIISQISQSLPAAIGMVEVAVFPNLRSSCGSGIFFLLAGGSALLSFTLYKMMLETSGMRVDEIVRQIHNVRSGADTIGGGQARGYGTIADDETSSLVSAHQ